VGHAFAQRCGVFELPARGVGCAQRQQGFGAAERGDELQFLDAGAREDLERAREALECRRRAAFVEVDAADQPVSIGDTKGVLRLLGKPARQLGVVACLGKFLGGQVGARQVVVHERCEAALLLLVYQGKRRVRRLDGQRHAARVLGVALVGPAEIGQ
jgi:hypothetical protein